MTAMPVLVLEDVSGGYGDIRVVNGVSLAVTAGEVACITGRNGVGKTTLMRLIAGFLPVMTGRIDFQGRDVGELKPHERNRLGLAYAPQENVVFDDLSVRENLTLHHVDRSLDRYESLFAAFPRMPERLEQKAGTLSGGERKILSFCRTLAERSDLVLLDEPTEGVQPENIALMAEAIVSSSRAGRAFIVVEQNLTLVEAVASQVFLLDHGECVFRTANGPEMRDQIIGRLKI